MLGVTTASWCAWACTGLCVTVAARSAVPALALAGLHLAAGTWVTGLATGDGVVGAVVGLLPPGLTATAAAAAARGDVLAVSAAVAGLLVTAALVSLLAVRVAARQDLR